MDSQEPVLPQAALNIVIIAYNFPLGERRKLSG